MARPPAMQRSYCCEREIATHKIRFVPTTLYKTQQNYAHPAEVTHCTSRQARAPFFEVNDCLPGAAPSSGRTSMKLMWFHLMPYTELPDDFNRQHPSVW